MARFASFLVCALALIASSLAFPASTRTVEHTFMVKTRTVKKLCQEQLVTAVNGSLPGPKIKIREGDILVVHVLNESPYNITIHWHGIFQLLSGWADGPEYVTQCPIQSGHSYTYRFKITGQEGTLWWHAHSSMLRATVYGALIIYPRTGRSAYPFPKPHKEIPILLGEWWNANVVDVENQAVASGLGPNNSDAYTINGKPGDLYPCSIKDTFKIKVAPGKTYLLRIINAALNNQLFFKIANHKLKVVAIDASYTNPYLTDIVVIAPGQTTDVLLTTDQPIGSYHMAAHPYISSPALPSFDNTTTRGLIVYHGSNSSSSSAVMPILPAFNDTPTAHKFYTNLTGLAGGPQWVPVPLHVDERMFVTIGVNFEACKANETCPPATGARMSASMNNESFVLPQKLSMLEAFFSSVNGIYTVGFPDHPPTKFDFTNSSLSLDTSLLFAPKSTKVKRVKYDSTVEIVLQNTALIGVENHPIHLHGFNFHVLAQGFGNYDVVKDSKKFNLVNPQIRNTIGVPTGGWAVIRFQANNPGMWLVHCHFDVHLTWGLAMVFEVENGPTPLSTLPPPPSDLPKC